MRPITPSESTVGVPLIVTTSSTRVGGSKKPRPSSSRSTKPPRASVKRSWNPLRWPADVVTVASTSAFASCAGTGSNVSGPISIVSCAPPARSGGLGTRASDLRRQRDPEHAVRLLELLRPHREVRVAEPPELGRVAEQLGRDHVEALLVPDPVLADRGEALRRR